MSDSPVLIDSFGPSSPCLTLQPFWSTDPCLWFAGAEAQFLVHHVDAEQVKFAHVVSALQPEVAKELRELIIEPPAHDPYNCIKQRLCSMSAWLQEKHIQEQLADEHLGTQKPSEFLRRLEQKLTEPYQEQHVKSVFIQKLPIWMRQVLDPVSSELNAAKLAELADRIVAQTTVMTASVEPVRLHGELSQVHGTLRELKSLVKQLSEYIEATHKLCNSNTEIKICWYHRRYGGKAYKCSRNCVLSQTLIPQETNRSGQCDPEPSDCL